jgi:hypothetical protein
MSEEGGGRIIARFKVHVRCDNCLRDDSHVLDVPDADEAPTSVDDLAESAFLERQRFTCSRCEYPIGLVTGIAQIREAAHA